MVPGRPPPGAAPPALDGAQARRPRDPRGGGAIAHLPRHGPEPRSRRSAAQPSRAARACPSGASLNVVAHEDDDLLFLNPDILRDLRAGPCARTTLGSEAGGSTPTSPNLALGGVATASSVETSGVEAGKASDGNASTRWSSSYANDQWWEVDLGSARRVDTVVVSWETAYASRYEIRTSTDGVSWQSAATVTATSAGVRRTTFTARTARFVRIVCTTRATGWGFSFWEAAVHGPG